MHRCTSVNYAKAYRDECQKSSKQGAVQVRGMMACNNNNIYNRNVGKCITNVVLLHAIIPTLYLHRLMLLLDFGTLISTFLGILWFFKLHTSSHILTVLSLSSSIEWDDCEGILVTGTGVVRTKGVVCLCEVVTVSTGDGCWVLLICHIVDEDRVPDIGIHTSYIQ